MVIVGFLSAYVGEGHEAGCCPSTSAQAMSLVSSPPAPAQGYEYAISPGNARNRRSNFPISVFQAAHHTLTTFGNQPVKSCETSIRVDAD
jgi:hypothetical protein